MKKPTEGSKVENADSHRSLTTAVNSPTRESAFSPSELAERQKRRYLEGYDVHGGVVS